MVSFQSLTNYPCYCGIAGKERRETTSSLFPCSALFPPATLCCSRPRRGRSRSNGPGLTETAVENEHAQRSKWSFLWWMRTKLPSRWQNLGGCRVPEFCCVWLRKLRNPMRKVTRYRKKNLSTFLTLAMRAFFCKKKKNHSYHVSHWGKMLSEAKRSWRAGRNYSFSAHLSDVLLVIAHSSISFNLCYGLQQAPCNSSGLPFYSVRMHFCQLQRTAKHQQNGCLTQRNGRSSRRSSDSALKLNVRACTSDLGRSHTRLFSYPWQSPIRRGREVLSLIPFPFSTLQNVGAKSRSKSWAQISPHKIDRLFACLLCTAKPLDESGPNLAWRCQFTQGRLWAGQIDLRAHLSWHLKVKQWNCHFQAEGGLK